MEINETDYKDLKTLEESLWITESRFDKEHMERTLADDFFEFGRSGRIYERNDTINGARPQEINAKIPLKNFSIRLITPDVALVTYISEVKYEELEAGNRSSLWHKTPSGWRLKFHQGTPVND
jgi:hypothetical protein